MVAESENRKRRGPKPRDAEVQRQRAVPARFNVEELVQLDKKCKAAAMPRGKFLRAAALSCLPPPPVPKINREAWGALSNAEAWLRFWQCDENAPPLPPDQFAVIEELRVLVKDVRRRLIGASPMLDSSDETKS
jgi:hypothetical protein